MSFLIRLAHMKEEQSFILENRVPDENWQIEVEHIQSGQHWAFSSLDQMLVFLRERATHPDDLPQAPGGD